MLNGKGVFIWQIQNCEGGDPHHIVAAALAAGLTHVCVKVADGSSSFPAPSFESATQAAIGSLQDAGIAVWGWQFVYGRNPQNTDERIARAEAEIAAQRVQSLGLTGFAIDFEITGHSRLTWHGDAQDAHTYMQTLRNLLPGIPLAGASHRYAKRTHPDLPWDAFLGQCDLVMPQVYWVWSDDPAGQLRASWHEYQREWPHLPYIPIGAAYGEAGWTASPDEITTFLAEARALGLPAASFWSWEHARFDAANSTWRGTELWDAIASFDWPAGAGIGDHVIHVEPTTQLLWVMHKAGLRFRNRPDPEVGAWVDRIVIPFGTQLTAVGHPTVADVDGYRFQRVQTPEGRDGWVTYSDGDVVYLTPNRVFPPPPAGSPERSVRVIATSGVKFRSETLLEDSFWIDGIVWTPGTVLTAVGDVTDATEQGYRWQYVRDAAGRSGWVAYAVQDYICLEDWAEDVSPIPASGSVEQLVVVTADLGLKFRSQTSVSDEYWIDGIVFLPGERLTAIGTPTDADHRSYRWQYVRTAGGQEGWVAYSIGDEIYLRVAVLVGSADTVWSRVPLDLHTAPGGSPVWRVSDNLPLHVLENAASAAAKISMPGAWLHVRTPSLKEGYVAGTEVRVGAEMDARTPLGVGEVRTGESPYLFGIHDPFRRDVFDGSGKNGWVLITEQVGANPATAVGNRNVYSEWASAGFGVIARLNHGYAGAGTLPEPSTYGVFAEACGNWVAGSRNPQNPEQGCHIWIIANEMNNPYEWPGNQNGHGGQPITPEGYAAVFNQAYGRIKAVQPTSIVCPGAIDPYNAVAGDSRVWFSRMLEHIDTLDGIILHTYTHGTDPGLITSTATFGDYPLQWQYYNFYAYRTFMDLIPGKWREVPVFITETDQIEPWADTNSGWVHAAYAEIDRWNQTPHHQQIRCLILYRWWTLHDDIWSLEHKYNVQQDLKQALSHDYRWRTTARAREHLTSGVSLGAHLITPPPSYGVHVGVSDDLKHIWGIGPKTEAGLHNLNIGTFAELARLTSVQIKARLSALGIPGRYVETWPEQARLAASEDVSALNELQAQIRARRDS